MKVLYWRCLFVIIWKYTRAFNEKWIGILCVHVFLLLGKKWCLISMEYLYFSTVFAQCHHNFSLMPVLSNGLVILIMCAEVCSFRDPWRQWNSIHFSCLLFDSDQENFPAVSCNMCSLPQQFVFYLLHVQELPEEMVSYWTK